MKKIILAVMMVFMAGQAWGATYYVSPSGDNTDGSTWAKAYLLPASAVTAGNAVSGPHTMFIAPGSYTSNFDLSNANWASGTIQGVSPQGVATSCVNGTCAANPASMGQAVITATAGQHGVSVQRTGVTIKNIDITGTDATHDTMTVGVANCTAQGLNIYDSGRYSLRVSGAAATGFSLTKSKITAKRADGAAQPVDFGGAAAGTISDTIIQYGVNAPATGSGALVTLESTGVVNLYNNLLIGGYSQSLDAIAAGTFNIDNNIIIPGTLVTKAINIGGGAAVNAYNNYIGMNWFSPHTLMSGTPAVDSGNIKTGDRLFKKYQRTGYVIPCVDDATGWDYARQVADELATRGMKGTFFVDVKSAIDPANKTGIQAIIDSGKMSTGVHSWSHSDMSYTHGLNFAGGASCTIAYDQSTHIFTGASCATGANNFTYDATGKTFGDIIADITGNGKGWTVTKSTTGGQLAANISNGIKATSLATKTATAVPTDVDFNLQTDCSAGYWKDEVKDALTTYQANFTGLTTLSFFASPFGSTSTNLQTAVLNAGYSALRAGSAATGANYFLKSINLYRLAYFSNGSFVGATTQDTVNYTHSIAQAIAQSGGIVFVLAHSTSEATIAQWRTVLDVLAQYPEIKVTDMYTAINDIKNGGTWTTADNITYTRTFTDQSDYRLKPSSSCKNAGLNSVWQGTPNVTDFSGRKITDASGNIVAPGGKVDIGAYEIQPSGAGSSFGNFNWSGQW